MGTVGVGERGARAARDRGRLADRWVPLAVALLTVASMTVLGSGPASASKVSYSPEHGYAGRGLGSPGLCEALDHVRNLDAQVERALNADWEWRFLQSLLAGSMRNAERYYRIAARHAPRSVRSDILTLARFTHRLRGPLEQSASLEAFADAIGRGNSRTSADLAASRLGSYSERVCGVALRSGL